MDDNFVKKHKLPDELRDRILELPLYKQRSVKRFLGNPSDSALEQGRLGIGAFAGLRFTRIGRSIFYKAADVVEFLESLPSYRNTTEADHAIDSVKIIRPMAKKMKNRHQE